MFFPGKNERGGSKGTKVPNTLGIPWPIEPH